MSHTVERAPRRGGCWICGGAVEGGQLRIVTETEYRAGVERETRYKRSYGHLSCFVEVHPRDAREALIARDLSGALLDEALREAEHGDPKLAAEVRAYRAEAYPVAALHLTAGLDDPRSLEILAALENKPNDLELWSVLADHLQLAGDARGELIALDLAGDVDLERAARRRALIAALEQELPPGKYHWERGFLTGLMLRIDKTLVEHEALLRHPSARLLRALNVKFLSGGAMEASLIPRSVRELTLHGMYPAFDASGLSSLQKLGLERHVNDAPLAAVTHPTVPRLELMHGAGPADLAPLARGLPGVRTLKATRLHGLVALGESGFLAQLEELALWGVEFADADLAALERGLAGRTLRRLSIGGCRAPRATLDRLRALCAELVSEHLIAPQEEPVVVRDHVEHTSKPEWGRGKILRRFEGKLEIDFPGGGTRVLKADSPLLKFS